MAPVTAGDKLPDLSLYTLLPDGPKKVSLLDLIKGKKVVLVHAPGAFTPICSRTHVPGFVKKAEEFRAKGVAIAIIACNDPFVMAAWKKDMGAPDDMVFLSDIEGNFVKALDIAADMSEWALGTRGRRCAMLVEDSQVKVMKLEEGAVFACSGADTLLDSLV